MMNEIVGGSDTVNNTEAASAEEFDLRLKAIAKNIKSTQAAAVMEIAKQLNEAREIFRQCAELHSSDLSESHCIERAS